MTPDNQEQGNHEKLAEYARFTDMNPGPVLKLDFNGLVILSNLAARKVFGEDLSGKNWRELCHEISDQQWQRIISAEEVIATEAHIGELQFILDYRSDLRSQSVFIFGTDITLQRQAERNLRQSEKMATLGTLAAGVAHELNNPAAAANRASQQLLDVIEKLASLREQFNALTLSSEEHSLMSSLINEAKKYSNENIILHPVERSDLESDLEDWLDGIGLSEAWEITPALVSMGYTKEKFDAFLAGIDRAHIGFILSWASYSFSLYSLIREIREGTGRISEIVIALKNYSFLGQAPLQQVSVHDGLNNTLIILRSKMKEGVIVYRNFCEDLPPITAYGSELNQVWTNLLDNAVDAMSGKGEIRISTHKEPNGVVVEIEDNGPGIPAEVQPYIFDPFYTTKEPGKGSGLGLSTSYGIIVQKHKGNITVDSVPGKTIFKVRLPFQPPK
ncbi:MAG: GHKL domain-containing protein [Saprospiraceae bacterium]|nr:GHKL domain-containing protein [Saprospiraceae bacterium]HMW40380.1 ATP-binding protein [Saprospiraceae bacterium]HMX89002.1 ATP-binding protein [Saprospiraceae bacterium]HMZ40102.1 ATP-binding protein [Saprospiraceae bacterium]HNA65489.1 ATP-binding protein [Saprospiraceae bacterium]